MSSSCPELSEANQDRISNLPDIATDKILKCLPLKMAAKMSVLSRKWKDKWLSHKHLVFDAAFWEEQNVHGGFNVSWIISNVLFYHNGPLYKFHLHIPKDAVWIRMCLSQWLSFISRTCVKKIALTNWVVCKTLPSHIFACKELVKLRLVSFVLNPPPSDFKGFACLRCLELCQMEFKTDFFGSLIASCPRLAVLRLDRCIGLDSVIIDAPSLESLVIEGGFNNLSFKNAVRLTNISICLDEKMYPKGITVLPYLATSCELQYLHFDGHFCKFFAGGLKDSIPVVFNHLSKLALTELDLGHFTVFRRVMAIIHSCPCIKDLEISVIPNKTVLCRKIVYEDNYKLGNLLKVKFTGITGSIAELQIIEYLLAVSVALELFLFQCGYRLDANAELKVSRDLLRFRRASTKAQLVCLD